MHAFLTTRAEDHAILSRCCLSVCAMLPPHQTSADFGLGDENEHLEQILLGAQQVAEGDENRVCLLAQLMPTSPPLFVRAVSGLAEKFSMVRIQNDAMCGGVV